MPNRLSTRTAPPIRALADLLAPGGPGFALAEGERSHASLFLAANELETGVATALRVREPEASGPPPTPSRRPRLLDRVREAARLRHLSRRTEKAYVSWVRRFILFSGKRHPAEMGAREVSDFLSWLAVERGVSASTQNQALSALLFLYRQVLGLDLPWLKDVVRAKAPRRLPVVLTREEVRAILDGMSGTPKLMATLLYGSGLRLLECARLRVKDIDLKRRAIHVRTGKGATAPPTRFAAPLRRLHRTV